MKEVGLGWLHKLWWAPAVASSLGRKTDRASHKLDCVRPERCLALVHRSWGLEGWNTKLQTMMSSISLSSQSRLEYWGPRRSDYIIPVRLETAFSQPNLQTQTGRALRDAAKITQRVVQFRKLCIAVERLTLEGGLFIASINQSIYWHIKRSQRKHRQFGFWVKCVWKLVICYLSSVKRNDKCAQSVWIAFEVIAKFYIWVGRTHFSLTPPLPCHSQI